ncbi:hypothetical protein ACFJX8_04945 [Enterococcus faecalis]|nr:dihydroxyacetone kinase subunit DhaK [Enterococcus faecalis]HAP3558603.1 dihydroxyacetone kinase subunit DhaK [Enterococcus faecalis]
MEDKKYTLNEIVDQLVGPVNPVADSRVDEERSENLDKLISLINHLGLQLFQVSTSDLEMYSSANTVIKKAKEASKELSEWFVEEKNSDE